MDLADKPPAISLRWWAVLISASAALAIAGTMLIDDPLLHWVCKPLTTLLIAAMALSLPITEPRYRRWVVIGLVFSTFGDVFLMLPGDWFVQGLLSFLLAHLAYLIAFNGRARFLIVFWPFAVYGLIAAVILMQLWPNVPSALRLPVLIYVLALASMSAQALTVWQRRRDLPSLYAAIGGAFFLISDGLLAWNRFVTPFEGSRFLVLSSYWIAQFWIARSVSGGTPR